MKKTCALLTLSLLSLTVKAQIQQAIDRFPFEEGITYDETIPSPAEFLG